MLQTVLMPKMGQTMEEGTVEKWHKREGDAVKKGEVLLEITTDKATMEVEALVSGVLKKILAAEGQVVPVTKPIALIGEPSDAVPSDLSAFALAAPVAAEARTAEAAAQVEAQPVAQAAVPAGRIIASPRAKKRAEDAKVSLALIKGTGPGGRIVEEDVVAYIEQLGKVKATPMARVLAAERGVDLRPLAATDTRITKADVLAAAQRPTPSALPKGEKRQPLSAMRRVIAQRMAQSKQEVPHFYLVMDMDMTAVAALRGQLNAKGDVKITFTDLIVRACALALEQNPKMLCGWAGDAIVLRGDVNIGVAVALDEGLIVPVIRNANQKPLAALSVEIKALAEKARHKRLTPDDYSGGCLTLSNLGMYDIDSFIPIINPGESAILGIGRIAERVVARQGGIHIRSMMTVTLSGDHRVVDGAIAAKFLKDMKLLLEDPQKLA
ncbi:MAG: 2-oxo acid dehydrogenase subunit E2 [Planctomycetes bacterium]|nr:2-oxo acid dehydrogenase subunit E2 [Planctomycetota bacterium]